MMSRGSALWQRLLAALVAAAVFWPQVPALAVTGLDPSWQAALALARERHLAWGPEIIFTFGPLGFLQNTAFYYLGQSVLATGYQMAVVAALFLGIAAALRCHRAPMTSLLGAFATTGIVMIVQGARYPDLAVLAAFAWASALLLQSAPRRSAVSATLMALGAFAGFQFLIKLNSGLGIAAIALGASVLLGWRAFGRHCAVVGAFAASIPVWWMFAGQRPGDLPVWGRFSAALVSGYSEAMATPLGQDGFPPLIKQAVPAVVLGFAWAVLLCAAFVRGRPGIPRNFVALVGLTTVIVAKAAFGRFDVNHLSSLLGLIVVALAVSPPFRASRFVIATALLGIVYVVDHTGDSTAVSKRVVAAIHGPEQAVVRLTTLALPGRFDHYVAQTKAHQRAAYAVPDRFIQTIGSRTVHIDPYETSAVWAYDFAWHPTPVFATYAAFSPPLDNLNGDSLARGPDFVLSRVSPASPATGIDGRLGVQESPRYSRALLCNYRLKAIENQWAMFARTGPHCGPPTLMSQVTVRGNAAVPIPLPTGPDKAVLVGIDLEPTLVDRLIRGAVFPLTASVVLLDGDNGYRLICANAAQPFLIRSPRSVEGTNLRINAHTLAFPTLGAAARFRFYEMSVEPGP